MYAKISPLAMKSYDKFNVITTSFIDIEYLHKGMFFHILHQSLEDLLRHSDVISIYGHKNIPKHTSRANLPRWQVS